MVKFYYVCNSYSQQTNPPIPENSQAHPARLVPNINNNDRRWLILSGCNPEIGTAWGAVSELNTSTTSGPDICAKLRLFEILMPGLAINTLITGLVISKESY
jgi:hypothetical protein